MVRRVICMLLRSLLLLRGGCCFCCAEKHQHVEGNFLSWRGTSTGGGKRPHVEGNIHTWREISLWMGTSTRGGKRPYVEGNVHTWREMSTGGGKIHLVVCQWCGVSDETFEGLYAHSGPSYLLNIWKNTLYTLNYLN